MVDRPLIARELHWLCDLGVYALLAAVLLRVSAVFWASGNWLLQSQIIGAALLLGAIFLAGTLLPRIIGDSALYFLGLLSWAMALSFIPRYSFWPTGQRPAWAYYGALAFLGLCLLYTFARKQRWYSRMRGKGWEWISDWAQDKPYQARKLARAVLKTLGYPGA